MRGSAGRIGRIRTRTEYRLTDHDQDMTQVELTFSTEPATPVDRLREALGMRPWLRAKWARALRRLGQVLEQGEPSSRGGRCGGRVAQAGYTLRARVYVKHASAGDGARRSACPRGAGPAGLRIE